MAAPVLVLASASQRRRELLDQLGVAYHCEPADIDETPCPGELPQAYVERMAREKALRVGAGYPGAGHVVLAADTTVVIDDQVLGKPRDRGDALAMLTRLSGRTHWVYTALSLLQAGEVSGELVATEVEFVSLTPGVCKAYLATDEPWDKAGAYAIQGLAGALVRSIRGSYSNVVGLPLCETWQLLRRAGVVTGLEPGRD